MVLKVAKNRENPRKPGKVQRKRGCRIAHAQQLLSFYFRLHLGMTKRNLSQEFDHLCPCTCTLQLCSYSIQRCDLWSNMSLVTVLRSPSTSDSTSLGDSVNRFACLLRCVFTIMFDKFLFKINGYLLFLLIGTLLGSRRRSGRQLIEQISSVS